MVRENEVPLRDKDDAALNEPSLLEKVAESIRESGAGDPTDVPESDNQKPDVDDVVDDDDTDDDDGVDDGDPADDQEDMDDSTEGKELPKIPDAYYRSAASFGWSPEDVASMVENNGLDNTVTMLENLHTKNNELSGQFAAMGRKAQEMDQVPDTPAKLDSAPSDTTPADFKALMDKHGDDSPELVQLLGSQHKQAIADKQRMDRIEQQLAMNANQIERQKAEANRDTIGKVNAFFAADGLTAFDKFYGKIDSEATDWLALTPAQMHNRDHVCQLANQIMVGAEMQGTDMGLDSAMERAHMVVSEPIAATIIREDILKGVEKRHKSRVARPSESKKSTQISTDGRPANRKELLARTEKRLAAHFGS